MSDNTDVEDLAQRTERLQREVDDLERALEDYRRGPISRLISRFF